MHHVVVALCFLLCKRKTALKTVQTLDLRMSLEEECNKNATTGIFEDECIESIAKPGISKEDCPESFARPGMFEEECTKSM